jgi:hypothetical protein
VYQSNRPMDQPVMSMWSPHSGIKSARAILSLSVFNKEKKKKKKKLQKLTLCFSGISHSSRMSVITDQLGVQIYSCTSIHSLDGSYEPIPRKKSHEGPHAIYENMSCIAIEQRKFKNRPSCVFFT